jgi:hypothetical protein
MRHREEVDAVLKLVQAGLSDRAISDVTALPRTTVRDWRRGKVPVSYGRPCAHDPDLLPWEQYAYLLGIYLGDGCLTPFPRGVWKLRVICDTNYPGILDAVCHAMAAVRGDGVAGVYNKPGRCVEVAMYWRHWPCVFPQHGPGPKWQRRIELVDWQKQIVEREREAFLCGLIDSDGCRITATYREKNGPRKYARYIFSNKSEDIHSLFTDSLDALGIHWTRANQKDTAVARQRDVRRLDQFIGAKE